MEASILPKSTSVVSAIVLTCGAPLIGKQWQMSNRRHHKLHDTNDRGRSAVLRQMMILVRGVVGRTEGWKAYPVFSLKGREQICKSSCVETGQRVGWVEYSTLYRKR